MVHNGSFANHATIRRELRTAGVQFDSENDTEVGARFIAKLLADGRDVESALKELCATFDGFYTLLVSNRDSFAVVRDAIAQPAVIADRRLGGDGQRIPRAGRTSRRRDRQDLGAGTGGDLRMEQVTATVTCIDLATTPLREVNALLHAPGLSGEFVLAHPEGAHNVAVGIDAPVKVTVDGHVGYYAAGMNQQAEITINGNAGTGVAENEMRTLSVK
jgi:hypothetical protein